MAGIASAVDFEILEVRKNDGRIARKSGSRKLYLDFFYHGIRIEKSTGLDDTLGNRVKAESLLKKIIELKKEGSLEFAKLFPGASEEEKSFHTIIEKGEYAPTPKGVYFGEYVKQWYSTIWVLYPAGSKQVYYKSRIDYWLVPYFGKMNFLQITGIELQKFIGTLKHQEGPNKGKSLARASIVNILHVLKTIHRNAIVQHRWVLSDPFLDLKTHLPKKRKKRVEVFRFKEWSAIIDKMDEFYKPVSELMVMTGLMASEIAALKTCHIRNGYLYIELSVVKGVESDNLKNEFRERRLFITKAIGEILTMAAVGKGPHDRLFTQANGKTFTAEKFQRLAWKPALDAADVPYRKPYTTRHTFAAWSLTAGTGPNKLVNLMGHASKQMIYEVYGRFVEGLDEDKEAIIDYFGEDFIKRASKSADRESDSKIWLIELAEDA